jgi:hypothetical protein
LTTIEEVHDKIMATALATANTVWQRREDIPKELKVAQTNVFQQGGPNTKSFSFQVEPGILNHPVYRRDKARLDQVTRSIAQQAIQTAITQSHRFDFAGLIVGAAREGKNYFDVFDDNPS